MNDILYSPSLDSIQSSQLYKFISKLGLNYSSFAEIHKWSIENLEEFWKEFFLFSQIPYSGNLNPVLQRGKKFQETTWFPNLEVNFAENILKAILYSKDLLKVWIYSYREDGSLRKVTGQEIIDTVAKLQIFLKQNGFEKGDRVVCYLPNIPETIFIMLAVTSLGGIFSSSSPDFGVKAVLDRFIQIEPKFFFFCDGYFYKSKKISKYEECLKILENLPSVRSGILVPFVNEVLDKKNSRVLEYSNILKHEFTKLDFPKYPFNTPVYIMYSSGTTGLPKCMVQGFGVFLNHHKEHILHLDLKPSETIFYFTTCGWMMWNWLVSALAAGSTIVLYEGNPFYPSPATLWKMAEELEISIFGTSAGYLAALQKSGYVVSKNHNLSKLRSILSTGSPLLAEQFDFVYQTISSKIQLASISGGTDLNGCFVLGNPYEPVRRGQIQGAGLGMDVEVWDENGHGVWDKEGELVCKQPFVSMPLFFWKDEDGKKYHSSYFEKFPNVWRHGDFAVHTKEGGFIILGRSDATLNPGGVRIGTADIYRVVETIPEIVDSLVIGQKWKTDERVILFVKLKQGMNLTDSLIEKIKQELRTQASPRHVPEFIFQVSDIPYTRNLKKVELTVKSIFEGRAITNKDSLHNPEVLEEYEKIYKNLNF